MAGRFNRQVVSTLTHLPDLIASCSRITSDIFTFDLLPDINRASDTEDDADKKPSKVTVSAHSKIVGGLSKELSALISAPMKEANERHVSFVKAGVNRQTFLKVLQYAYSGEYNFESETGVDRETLVGHAKVYAFASMWNVEGLCEASSLKFADLLTEIDFGTQPVSLINDVARFLYQADAKPASLPTDQVIHVEEMIFQLLEYMPQRHIFRELSQIKTFVELFGDSPRFRHDMIPLISKQLNE